MNGILRNGVVLEALVDMSFAQNKSVSVKDVLMTDEWWQYINQQRLAIIEKFDLHEFRYDFDWLWRELLPLLDNMSDWEVMSDIVIGLDSIGCAHELGLDEFSVEKREEIAAILLACKAWNTEEEAIREILGCMATAEKYQHALLTLKALYATDSTQSLVDYCFENGIKGNDVFLIGRKRWDDLDEYLHSAKVPLMLAIDGFNEEEFEDVESDCVECDAQEFATYQWEQVEEWPMPIDVIQFVSPLYIEHKELGKLKGLRTLNTDEGNFVTWLWKTSIDEADITIRVRGGRFGPAPKELERAKWLVANFKTEEMKRIVEAHWNDVNSSPIPSFIFVYNIREDLFEIQAKDKMLGAVFYTNNEFRFALSRS